MAVLLALQRHAPLGSASAGTAARVPQTLLSATLISLLLPRQDNKLVRVPARCENRHPPRRRGTFCATTGVGPSGNQWDPG